MPDISAMAPVLSLMGPNASMGSPNLHMLNRLCDGVEKQVC